MKLIRHIRAGTPATVPSRQAHEPERLVASRSMSVPAAASTSRAFGPPTATTDHCSVTLVQYTCRSVHSVWSHSSKRSSTAAAPPVVVVTT